MSIHTLKIKAEILENEIGVKNTELKAIRQEIAEMTCPYNVGDMIVNTADRLQRAVVERIKFGGWSCDYKVFAHKIKKDGELYKYSNELWYPQKWEKETDNEKN